MPKNGQIWLKIGIFGQFGPGHAFGALLVCRLVVVARGLYLARHLFTLFCYLLLTLLFSAYCLYLLAASKKMTRKVESHNRLDLSEKSG